MISYVSVSYCTATPGIDWVADTTCVNGGNNVGWIFPKNYISVSYSRVSPINTWLLSLNSVDGGNNIGWGISVTPTTLALILTGYAPTVLTPRLVTPTTLALSLTGYAPTVSTPRLVTPTTLALILTTYAPEISFPGRSLASIMYFYHKYISKLYMR